MKLRFDDEMVRESGSDGVLWLRASSALGLSHLLQAALKLEATVPAIVRKPGECGRMVIAVLGPEVEREE